MAVRLWLASVLVLALAACSGVPHFPDRWFEPSPTPGPPAPATVPRPDVDLSGILATDQGLTATVTSQLWWDDATISPLVSRPRPAGWSNVRVPVHGALTVTNTSNHANAAASSVFYELDASYPLHSRVCQLVAPPTDHSMTTGGSCWLLVGIATPFSYYHGPPVAMQPGQAQTVNLGPPRPAVGVSVDAPDAEVAAISEALRNPSVVALTTTDIGGLGPTFRYDRNCPGAITGPRPRDREQHVNLSSTSPLTCAQLPQLGFE